MNELALFAGAGGGILGGKLLGWRTVCAVENDPYARDVLMARQNDGCLEAFPIWDDVRTFDGRPWRGRVDVVSGGFPCQPFSTASRGRRTATDLWPEMWRIINEVRPRFVFAENVQRNPIEDAARMLRNEYRSVEFAEVSAAAMGAPHHRSRWWVLADSDGHSERIRTLNEKAPSVHGFAECVWPSPGAAVLGDDDGMAARMDRLRCIGNGQVPAVAALAFELLRERINQNAAKEMDFE